MYYNKMEDYIGDKVDFASRDGIIERKLQKGLFMNYKGQKVPVTLNAFKSAFIIKK